MSNLEMQVNALMGLCLAENDRDREQLRREVRRLMEDRKKAPADAEAIIGEILLELGAPEHLLGHPYVVRAIALVAQDRMYIRNITFGLYPQLAVEFDTRPARVERAIRHLIEVTWSRGDWDILQRYFGNTVSADKGKPTNGEFIARLSNVVKARLRGESGMMQ
ncbi:MAG: sporulation initiation factor Spo0A C-terminal domain-containing protein [Eubacteriales bacterium]|nr:sporulation initiation factor Spo0A C-terminal domain-containing protein [Eubacteriales bacterium]